ncbi:MAG: DUF3127 domain-containing protein [Prevotella sp.]|nr:DUF3127 domain-containing protein [Prevotella sp.]
MIYIVKKVLAMQSGVSDRGEWKSQDLVVEELTPDVQYPNQYLLRLSGNNVNMLNGIVEGCKVEAMWYSRVREYKTRDGKTMLAQEHRCWKVERADGDKKQQQDDNLIF